jgi:hypothetical protein
VFTRTQNMSSERNTLRLPFRGRAGKILTIKRESGKNHASECGTRPNHQRLHWGQFLQSTFNS